MHAGSISSSVRGHSCVLAQAWSIMYLSWLTFILLLGACLLWMLPNSRRGSLVASPLLVLYVVCLLLAQYVYNMDLEKELPVNAGIITLAEIGLMRFDTAPKDLAVQVGGCQELFLRPF